MPNDRLTPAVRFRWTLRTTFADSDVHFTKNEVALPSLDVRLNGATPIRPTEKHRQQHCRLPLLHTVFCSASRIVNAI